ncbi:MAG: SDR family NAD(P)-dependent oxidoreductase [gamma proteobacterium symbiont of Taylorina sp.]|nr:SDR family NAD(P)-dependent oxidoreductase [gamma proteobacterium symbiont of Taylorina sp.]
MKSVFITGCSRGLGKGITDIFLEQGYSVFGCSRTRTGNSFDNNLVHQTCDLSDLEQIPDTLRSLLSNVTQLDVVILSAGILGDIKLMQDTTVSELEQITNINVWSNKVILDFLLKSDIAIKQIILISSGASIFGNKGWSGYALSKATLNMLAKLYAHEFSDTHIAAIAPGLIDTGMMDYLCNKVDSEKFPALKRIKAAKGTPSMLSPQEAAQNVFEALVPLTDWKSGSFVDLRQIFSPDEYAELMKK